MYFDFNCLISMIHVLIVLRDFVNTCKVLSLCYILPVCSASTTKVLNQKYFNYFLKRVCYFFLLVTFTFIADFEHIITFSLGKNINPN